MKASSTSPSRATSTCCCMATRSPTGGCRRRTSRCSTSTSASIKTANFAIAGDTTQGVLWGLRNGEGQGFQPKAVMLMIGTNNSGTLTAPEIAEGVGAVVLELRRNFPAAKILLLGDLPAQRAGRSGARQDRGGQPDHRRSSTTSSTCSTWTSARSSSTRKACSSPTRSGPTICIRRRRDTRSGERLSAPSSRS